MSLIAWLLNWTNKNYDHQITALAKALLSSSCVVRWVGGGLQVTTNQVATGEAFILCTRTNGQKVMVHVELTEAYTISTSWTKKVYIVIDQAKLDDGSANVVDGSGIASIGTDTSYPSGNYVALASITWGTITDARVFMDENTKLPFDIFWVANHGDDTYTITPIVPVTTLKIWQTICFVADVTNNGASAVAIVWYNSGTPIPIKKRFNVDTATGDIPAWSIFMGKWDGTNVQMMGMVATAPSVSIGALTEYTDPDWDEWDIVEKPDGSQFKVRWATRRGMPKPPASWAMNAWSPVYFACGTGETATITQTNTAGGDEFVGYSTTKRKLAQSFTTTWQWVRNLVSIVVKMHKTGSPTGQLTCKVYEWQNGTLLATSAQVAESSLAWSNTDTTFSFNKELLPDNNSNLYFVIETTRADSTSNYVNAWYSNTNLYSWWACYNVNSSDVFSAIGSSRDLAFTINLENTASLVFKASSQTWLTGILKKTVSALNDPCNIQPTGTVRWLSLWNETDTISSTVDINSTSNASSGLQIVYSGIGTPPSDAFFTWPTVGNLVSFDKYITQTGTGWGILTANIFAVSDLWSSMVKTGSSLWSAVINSPTASAVNTFTPGSPITLKPNTWYIIEYTSASGNVSNLWSFSWNSSGTDNGRLMYSTWGTWNSMSNNIYLVTRYTSQVNYKKGDIAWLSDTPGAIDTYRKSTKLIPIGTIIDSSNILLEKFDWNTLIWSATLAINTTYIGSITIPKNTTKIVIEYTVGSGAKTRIPLSIWEFSTLGTLIDYDGAGRTTTFSFSPNYLRALSYASATLTAYFFK